MTLEARASLAPGLERAKGRYGSLRGPVGGEIRIFLRTLEALAEGVRLQAEEGEVMRTKVLRPARGLFLGILALAVAGCASSSVTTRTVDEPVGEAVAYGAPHDTTYTAELDAGREYGTVTVYKKSVCQVIPVTVMQRYKETTRGKEVLERSPMNKRQVAGEPQGEIVCDQGYARNMEVLLEAEGGRFSLGTTDELGRVETNLARVFKIASFEEVPGTAKVMLRSIKGKPLEEVGQLSLLQLKKHEERVVELIGKLEAILEKGAAAASPDEITRSYEIYNQMVDVAAHDPRVRAMAARFWELFYGRKLEESRERLGKNLDALKDAQALLRSAGDAAIPLYVQAAVNSGSLDDRALEWSSLRLIRALRGAPSVCTAGFAWTGLPSYGWTEDALLAANYVHFAYGSAHAEVLRRVC